MADVRLVLGIEIEGNKLLLSEEAAKELYRKLKEIFEDKHSIQFIPYPYPVYPTYPVWINPIYVTPLPVIIEQPHPTWYGYGANTSGSYCDGSITITDFGSNSAGSISHF